MISKIRSYLLDLKKNIASIAESQFRITSQLREVLYQIDESNQLHHMEFLSLKEEMAAITKRVSSIEMEMLLARDACLDNNFEGKEEM